MKVKLQVHYTISWSNTNGSVNYKAESAKNENRNDQIWNGNDRLISRIKSPTI